MRKSIYLALSILLGFFCTAFSTWSADMIQSGAVWPDNNGVHINAHGGGILFHEGKYYWFGEHKSDRSNAALVGVTCYSSEDLMHWKNEGVALSVDKDNPESEIARGCIMERPKVVYNEATGLFVMWFHLELKNRGYSAARAGLAVSEHVTGPYRYVRSCRPNAGHWPLHFPEASKKPGLKEDSLKWWSSEWLKAVQDGLFVRRDFEGGQMSRDMTIFVDDDGKAYHLFASEENLTLDIAELSDDYQSHTGKYIRVAPTGHNEAPAMFKKNGTYYLITSGCTGWAPNAARSFRSKSIWGPWKQLDNPWQGDQADISFDSQSTFIFQIQGKNVDFVFMADRWRPDHPSDGRYVWIPIEFQGEKPVLNWTGAWSPENVNQTFTNNE
jgi:hypothetical protein